MQPSISDSLVEVLKKEFPNRVGLHEPFFGGNEWAYVKECIDTGWVSSVGKFVDQFESKLAEFTGSPFAVVTANGTVALHMCFVVAGVEQNDEILIPALSFVATANAVAYCKAIPHFVDVNEKTLGIDAEKLKVHLEAISEIKNGVCYNKKTGRKIVALVPMHTYGYPVDLDPLVEICEKFKLSLIEDAAESLGSYYKGKHTGNHGKLSSLSFNGNKILTTGGGGAILTHDPELAKKAKHITTTAKVPHPYQFFHDMTGYNYRLPNLNAALGMAQLEQLPKFLEQKLALHMHYQNIFQNFKGAKLFTEPSYSKSNHWLNVLLLDKSFGDERDLALKKTNEVGIGTRPAWVLLNKLPMYAESPKMDLSCSLDLEQRLINLPSSAFLGKAYV